MTRSLVAQSYTKSASVINNIKMSRTSSNIRFYMAVYVLYTWCTYCIRIRDILID